MLSNISILASRFTLILFTVPAIALGILIYYPGISGPFVFDDYSNILINDYIKIKSLDLESLKHAAFSLQSGPLQRPIPMASFALNYYFGNGFTDTTPYKATNLGIHIINGFLVFWFLRLLYGRLGQLPGLNNIYRHFSPSKLNLVIIACSLLWLIHPIQLTSVLYIVQRMASLSALFMLLGMIFYLIGRQRQLARQGGGTLMILTAFIVFGGLGLLSKENTALLPLYFLLFEFVLFPNEAPWKYWRQLSIRNKRILAGFIIIVISICSIYAFHYALNSYGSRDYTMWERLLTEPRVLLFYISLIFIPRIDQFALYHDDIVISTSLISPWSTLPSIIIILGLLATGLALRKRNPLLSLGILWFFTGHLLESTIFNLEIAHEHRNYIPSLGILFILVHIILWIHQRYNKKVWITLPILILLLSGTTLLRSIQWSNYHDLFYFEALHHPKSPRTQSEYGISLYKLGKAKEALTAMRHAALLAKNEPGYYINMHIIAIGANIPLTAEEKARTNELLRAKPESNLSFNALHNIHGCIRSTCKMMQKTMEGWLRILINEKPNPLSYYMLGRTLIGQKRYTEAEQALRRSYKLDPAYLHPLFELAYMYIEIGRIDKAEKVLNELRKANSENLHPRNREIQILDRLISRKKQKANI